MKALSTKLIYLPLGLSAVTIISSATATKAEIKVVDGNTSRQQNSPENLVTTAAALQPEIKTSLQPQIIPETNAPQIAQAQTKQLANTSDSRNYVGAAYHSGIGSGGVAVISKFRVNNNLSLRPTAAFASESGVSATVFGVPITYDFQLGNGSNDNDFTRKLTPYAGVGIYYVTAGIGGFSDSGAGAYVTGGADYRFSEQFVGNVGFQTGFGLSLGVAYNF